MKEINNLFNEKEWDELVSEANDMVSGHPYLRFGQCLFNIAYSKKPDVVNRLRGTYADPFYVGHDINHEVVQAFKSNIVN